MNKKAYFVGGGVGSLAAAFFLIRDAGFDSKDIIILENSNTVGGSIDGCGNVETGFLCRGGRMLNGPTFECMWELLKDIPSLKQKNKSVYQEIWDFDAQHPTHCNSRLVNKHGQRLDVQTMGFSHRDRM